MNNLIFLKYLSYWCKKLYRIFCGFVNLHYLCPKNRKESTKGGTKMKVNTAVVRLVLRTNKTLADGTHPIMLRVSWKGTKEKSTGVSCRKTEWDKKAQMLKKNVKNCAVINSKLREVLRYYQDARDALEALKTPYTASMVLEWNPDKVKNSESGDLMGLEELYEQEYALSPQTIPNRRSVVRMVEGYFRRSVNVLELNNENVNALIKSKLKEGRSEGYLRGCFRIICSLTKFAKTKGIPVQELDARIGKRLSEARSLVFVHRRSVEFMKKYLMKEVESQEKFISMSDPNSDLFALAFWLLSYILQGLAPVDLALLKNNQIKSITVNGVHYYAIDLARSKTRQSVKIRKRKDDALTKRLFDCFHYLNTDPVYFLPLLRGLEASDSKAVRGRLSYKLARMRPKFRRVLGYVNGMIGVHNRLENDNVPLIDVNKVNFYAARHSFAQAYLSTPNASPVALATLMGRSVNTLATYVQQLTEESDIVEVADVGL